MKHRPLTAGGPQVSEPGFGASPLGGVYGVFALHDGIAAVHGRYGDDDFDFSARSITRSVYKSLARLGVDYVDLIQCHDIEFGSLRQSTEEAPAGALGPIVSA